MGLEFEKAAYVTVSATEWVEKLRPHEVAEFASAVAKKFDQDFVKRAEIAAEFADGLSEDGVRWLAEVVTNFYGRKRQ